MDIQVEQLPVGGFDKNFSYIVYAKSSLEGYIVDPSGSWSAIQSFVEDKQIAIIGILLTHTHPDHQDALQIAVETYPVPVYVHEAGRGSVMTGNPRVFSDGKQFPLGEEMFTALFTPGHSPDSSCLYIPGDEPKLIAGDTVFINGCGRTSESGAKNLYESIQRIKELPSQTTIYPGHDYGPVPYDTLNNQLKSNQYLIARDFPTFCQKRLGYTIPE